MPVSKGNRTKGNVKPSSSSRAAELLSQSGVTGFIGFGSGGGAQAYVPASEAFDDGDCSLDSDFRVVLRKLTKRDATTKIKTLAEFSALCKEKEDSTVQAILPFWPRLFNKLAIDTDPKVREYTQNAMATLVGRVRRNLAPYLKNVMGVWILSRNDTYPTVSSAANRSFSAAFPPEKQESAIVFCKQAVLEYLIDNLLNQTPSSLSDPKTTEKEEMEAKYQRVVSSSLMGLRQLLQALPLAQVNEDLRGHLRRLLNDAKFWNLSKSQVASVRYAQFWLLGSLCQVVPDLAGEYVRKIAPLALGSVDLLEPGFTAPVWDALLSCAKFVPTCWEHINWQKAFWPKLRKVLENGCQGNATSVAPNFLPLFSCIPMETAGGVTVFFPKVFDLFKEGFSKDCVSSSVSETNAWAKSFMECVQFSFRQILASGEPAASQVLRDILLDQVTPIVEASLFDPKATLSRSVLYSCLSPFLRSLATDADTSPLGALFWSQLSSDLVKVFDAVETGENAASEKMTLRPDRVVTFIRTLINAQEEVSMSSKGKSVGVRFAAEESRLEQSVPKPVTELTEELLCFVKTVVVGSHKLYRRDGQSVHLKLFVDLANLYFPEDVAAFVLRSLDNESEGSWEGNAQTGEKTGEVETDSMADAHSRVIDRVVLPVLCGKEGDGDDEEEVVGHSMALLFACLPYLSKESSTRVWDKVLQRVDSSTALCSLVERALEKRRVMPQVTDWLSSQHLHARLCDLVAMVTCQHSAGQLTGPKAEEVEQGWRVICLVLSANDDNEPVFPTSWIVDIVSGVRQELVTLASRPLGQQEVQRAVQFVAKAALTFFQNHKMSLCIDEGRDVIVALLMADLDSTLPLSGEASSLLRQSWTTGLGLAVQETGGLIQDGSILSSACHVVKEAVLTKTHTSEQYHHVVEITGELLKTIQCHLPQPSEDDPYNPLLLEVVSDLLTPSSTPSADRAKVLEYHCLCGQLPLLALEPQEDDDNEKEEELKEDESDDDDEEEETPEKAEHSAGRMDTMVFSSLFNLYLLRCVRAEFRFDGGQSEDGEPRDIGEPLPWKREKKVLFGVMKALVLATSWCKLESKLSPDVVGAVEELTKSAHASFSSVSQTVLHWMLDRAFTSIKKDPLCFLTFTYMGNLQQSRQQGKGDPGYFQRLYDRFAEKLRYVWYREAVITFLPPCEDSVSVVTELSLLDNASGLDPSVVTSLRVLGAMVSKDPALMSSSCGEGLTDVVTALKTWRDKEEGVFLFSCDVSEESLHRTAFNMAAMRFLTSVLTSGAASLTSDQWDFILCSVVSWVQSVESSNTSLQSAMSVQAFCVETCGLVAAVAGIMQRAGGDSDGQYPPNLTTEWTEFFAEGIYAFLFPLFIRLVYQLKETSTKGVGEVVLRAVGSAMAQCPQEQVTAHQLPLKLAASDDTSPVPESLQTVLNHLCPMLTCPSPPAQMAAFAVLDKIITLVPSYHKKEEAGASADASAPASARPELEPRSPPAALMKIIDDCAAAMDVVLAPVPMETTLLISPGTEEYQFALGYLLAWQLLLRLFHSADSTGRAEYAVYLKEHSCVQRFLSHLFRLMPHSPPASGFAATPVSPKAPGNGAGGGNSSLKWSSSVTEEKEKSPSKPAYGRVSEDSGHDSWFSSSDLPFSPVDVGVGRSDVQRASCRLYLHCLQVMPVLVRQWWKDQDRKSAAYIDKFTTKYVSQQLIRSEMQTVNSSDSVIQNLEVKASRVTRQVTASYSAEELNAEMEITLPENFPLGEITVDARRHAVVKLAQWERMLLQVNVFMQHQNGSIMEGLKLWKRNIDKKLEGVEECFICYAVIHATNLDLPRIPCKTCKKKFHSSCLYKWLNSSQNATCPLCRSVFF